MRSVSNALVPFFSFEWIEFDRSTCTMKLQAADSSAKASVVPSLQTKPVATSLETKTSLVLSVVQVPNP